MSAKKVKDPYSEPFFKKPWFWMLTVLIALLVACFFAFQTFRQQKAKVDATNAARSSAVNKDPKELLNDNAHYFGNLSTQDLQADSQKYVLQPNTKDSTVYVWRVDSDTTLVRIEQNDQITIYKYAEDQNEMLKNQLYQRSK